MKKQNLVTRVIAIILCALMVLSIGAIALTRVFAFEAGAVSPDTGSSNTWIIFAVAGGAALIAAIAAIATTKKKQ